MSDLFGGAVPELEETPEVEAPDTATIGMFPDVKLAEPAGVSPAAYRVLARKYRPSTFDELIGQDALVRTLTNAIATGRLAQAWMLTGVRGVGKTTTARIIARALNCMGTDGQGGPTATPCGQCGNCVAIAADRHVDVLEMDAASRTGVDDIRDIIDGVRYGPTNARYKIYIIDEVHMLSKNAFNALLKTLEEPPPHAKFIFATTEIRKVPVTVLSRCQRFDLRRVDAALLAQHFTSIAQKEQVTLATEAANLLARAADGSVRDGLSLLDQAIARSTAATVNAQDVREMLGLADRARILELAKLVLTGNMADALKAYDDQLAAGADPLTVLQDIAEVVHLLTREAVVPGLRDDSSLPELERDLVRSMPPLGVAALTRAWQIVLKGLAETQAASHPAKAAEMVLIRIAYAAQLPVPSDLVRKVTEEFSAQGQGGKESGPGGGPGPVAQLRVIRQTAAAAAEAVAPQVMAEKSVMPQPGSFRDLVALFEEKREARLYALLYQATHLVRFERGQLELSSEAPLPPSFAGDVGKLLTQWTGQRWMVAISKTEGAPTLAAQDRAIQQAREAAVMTHPTVQALLAAFPNAKMTSLIQRTPAPPPAVMLDSDTVSDHFIPSDSFPDEGDL